MWLVELFFQLSLESKSAAAARTLEKQTHGLHWNCHKFTYTYPVLRTPPERFSTNHRISRLVAEVHPNLLAFFVQLSSGPRIWNHPPCLCEVVKPTSSSFGLASRAAFYAKPWRHLLNLRWALLCACVTIHTGLFWRKSPSHCRVLMRSMTSLWLKYKVVED